MDFTKTTKNTIIKTFMHSKTTPEVDFEMYDDVLGRKDANDAYEGDGCGVMYIDNAPYYHNSPMKIDDAIKILNELKEKGANYVSIDFNCDHPDYTFEGFEIRRATEAEIEEDNEKEKSKAHGQAEALHEQARKLLEQADKLE